MTYRLVFSPLARADIVDALEWSIENFGGAVRDGYEALIQTALQDISVDPKLAGSHDRPEIGPGVRSVYVRTIRDHVPPGVRRIQSPRHVVFYRQVGDTVHVSRVLHETRDFSTQRFA